MFWFVGCWFGVGWWIWRCAGRFGTVSFRLVAFVFFGLNLGLAGFGVVWLVGGWCLLWFSCGFGVGWVGIDFDGLVCFTYDLVCWFGDLLVGWFRVVGGFGLYFDW